MYESLAFSKSKNVCLQPAKPTHTVENSFYVFIIIAIKNFPKSTHFFLVNTGLKTVIIRKTFQGALVLLLNKRSIHSIDLVMF